MIEGMTLSGKDPNCLKRALEAVDLSYMISNDQMSNSRVTWSSP